MVAKRPIGRRKSAAIILLAVVMLSLSTGFAAVASADLPNLHNNGDGTRTITWRMNTTDGLTLQGVELANGHVTLPWRQHNLTWAGPAQFAANVLSNDNLSYETDGITLRADTNNYVADGDFSTAAPWSFVPSPGGNVTAGWENALAVFRHNSPSTEGLWDSLDSTAGWFSSPGSQIWPNTTGQREGSGMLGLNFSLPSTPGSYAGALHAAPINWSRYDRMVIWILPLDVGLPLTFNVTAFVGTTLRGTTAQALRPGWQEVVIDLTEFGASRDALAGLTLRLNGQNVPLTTVYFDDLRVGNAKRFDETARVGQTFMKPNATSSALGNAVLRFNWSLSSAIGAVSATGLVNVSGSSSSFERAFTRPAGSGWNSFVADISAATASPGAYDVSVRLDVVLDNTSLSSIQAGVDNVSIVFPNRHNGTYLSQPVPLGAASEFFQVAWSVSLTGSTAVQTALRSGNDTTPGSATWSAWQTWNGSGTYALTLPGAAFVQVRVDLMTANSSRTPLVRGVDLETRHRATQGFVVSSIFSIPDADRPFRWRTLNAFWVGSSSSTISFSVGDGSYWQSLAMGGDLSKTVTSASIKWNATLGTSDGLVSPSLESVELVYELRPTDWWDVAAIPYMPYVLAALTASVLGYVGYAFTVRRMFAIDDIFLISKEGRLMMHNTRRMRADRDEDILSAMLTAILSFLMDFDREENGDLRRFELGGKTALLERGKNAYLAAVYSGRVPRWAAKDLRRFMDDLERRFGQVFAGWSGDPQDLQGLKEFSDRFVSRLRYRRVRERGGRAS